MNTFVVAALQQLVKLVCWDRVRRSIGGVLLVYLLVYLLGHSPGHLRGGQEAAKAKASWLA